MPNSNSSTRVRRIGTGRRSVRRAACCRALRSGCATCPSDPKTSGELDTLMAMWFFPVAALAFGMLFIGLGIVLD
jgi:hypothetical protein